MKKHDILCGIYRLPIISTGFFGKGNFKGSSLGEICVISILLDGKEQWVSRLAVFV
jgi:hypothetical protein